MIPAAGHGRSSAVLLPALIQASEPFEALWLLVLAGVVVLIAAFRARRDRRVQEEADDTPLLVFTNAPAASAGEPVPVAIPVPTIPHSVPGPPHPTLGVHEGSETVRFDPALMTTVQLLPGRFVAAGRAGSGREYRFLRSSGEAVTEVSIGRNSGPSGRHVHLPVPTVSRVHARLYYENRGWTVTNLSSTNPLRVNGREIGPDARVPLADGDRLQVGEVELRYLETPS